MPGRNGIDDPAIEGESSMMDPLMVFRNSEVFADVLFEVGDRVYPGHAIVFHSYNKFFKHIIQKQLSSGSHFPLRIKLLMSVEKMEQTMSEVYNLDPQSTSSKLRFSRYLNSSFASDIILIAETESIFCHRVLLAAHSPYFHQLLTQELANASVPLLVKIPSERAILSVIFECIHTNSLKKILPSIALQVLEESHNLGFYRVFEHATKVIASELNVNNVSFIWVLSRQLGYEALEEKAGEFFHKNLLKVLPTSDFQKHASALMSKQAFSQLVQVKPLGDSALLQPASSPKRGLPASFERPTGAKRRYHSRSEQPFETIDPLTSFGLFALESARAGVEESSQGLLSLVTSISSVAHEPEETQGGGGGGLLEASTGRSGRNKTSELQELCPKLNLLIDLVTKKLWADRGTLWLLSDDGKHLCALIAQGIAQQTLLRTELGSGLVSWCFLQDTPVLTEDASADPRFSASVDNRSGYKTKQVLCVPLHPTRAGRPSERAQPLGCLQIINSQLDLPFTEENVWEVSILGEVIGTLIQETVQSPVDSPQPTVGGGSLFDVVYQSNFFYIVRQSNRISLHLNGAILNSNACASKTLMELVAANSVEVVIGLIDQPAAPSEFSRLYLENFLADSSAYLGDDSGEPKSAVFPCHRSAMLKGWRYVGFLFDTALSEYKSLPIDFIFLEMTPPTLRLFLLFVYRGTITEAELLEISPRPLEHLWQLIRLSLCSMMKDLQILVEKFIIHRIAPDNACSICQNGKELALKLTTKAAFDYVVVNLPAVSQSQEFLALGAQMLLSSSAAEFQAWGSVSEPNPPPRPGLARPPSSLIASDGHLYINEGYTPARVIDQPSSFSSSFSSSLSSLSNSSAYAHNSSTSSSATSCPSTSCSSSSCSSSSSSSSSFNPFAPASLPASLSPSSSSPGSSDFAFESVMKLVYDKARRLNRRKVVAFLKLVEGYFGAEGTTLFSYHQQTDELVSQTTRNLQIHVKKDQGIAGRVFCTGQLMNVSDAYSHPDFNPLVDKQTGFRTRNMICSPVFYPSAPAEPSFFDLELQPISSMLPALEVGDSKLSSLAGFAADHSGSLSSPPPSGRRILGVLQIVNKKLGPFTSAEELLTIHLCEYLAVLCTEPESEK